MEQSLAPLRCVVDVSTKSLLKRIRPHEAAVLRHEDVDELAAEALIEREVAAVINLLPTFSGKYLTAGPRKLLEHRIRIFDVVPGTPMQRFREGMPLWLGKGQVGTWNDQGQPLALASGEYLTWEKYWTLLQCCRHQHLLQWERFVDNSLRHALEELEGFLQSPPLPKIGTNLAHQVAVVVSRGRYFRQDLASILPAVRQLQPVYIAVDGGADLLLECGVTPHIVVGDMDSISDQALRCGAELVVHGYRNGEAPGMKRLKQLGLNGQVFASGGTSEDAALMLAFRMQAKWIVQVGSHSTMTDFMEKGRKGMGSTLLVRLLVGERLVDAKGFHLLLRGEQPSLVAQKLL